jgi:hypothetical protein
MLCGLALNIYIWGFTRIAWTWYVTFGAIVTFGVGYVVSMLENDTKDNHGDTEARKEPQKG